MSAQAALPFQSLTSDASEDAKEIIRLSSVSNTLALICSAIFVSVTCFYLTNAPLMLSVKTLTVVSVFGVLLIYPLRLQLKKTQWIIRIGFSFLLLALWSWTLTQIGREGSEYSVLIVLLATLVVSV